MQSDEGFRRAHAKAANEQEAVRWANEDLDRRQRAGESFETLAPGLVPGDTVQRGTVFVANASGRTLAVPINRWGQYVDPFTGQIINREQATRLAGERGSTDRVTDEQLATASDFARAWDAELLRANLSTRSAGTPSVYVDAHNQVGMATDRFLSEVSVDGRGRPVWRQPAGGAAALAGLMATDPRARQTLQNPRAV